VEVARYEESGTAAGAAVSGALPVVARFGPAQLLRIAVAKQAPVLRAIKLLLVVDLGSAIRIGLEFPS
jgi:hypothetical protein